MSTKEMDFLPLLVATLCALFFQVPSQYVEDPLVSERI